MFSNILKLQLISLTARVTQELENHIGIRDKTLAEFIIELGKDAPDEEVFKNTLQENDAEFPQELVSSLYKLIKKMLNIQSAQQQEQQQQDIPEQQIHQLLPDDPLFKYQNKDVFQEGFFDQEADDKSKIITDKKKNELAVKFPALAIKNQSEGGVAASIGTIGGGGGGQGFVGGNKFKNEQIDLDLNFDDGQQPQPKQQQIMNQQNIDQQQARINEGEEVKVSNSSQDNGRRSPEKDKHRRAHSQSSHSSSHSSSQRSRSRSHSHSRKHHRKHKKSPKHHSHHRHRHSSSNPKEAPSKLDMPPPAAKKQQQSNPDQSITHASTATADSSAMHKYSVRDPSQAQSQQSQVQHRNSIEDIQKNQIYDGVVTKVSDFGCFVQLNNFTQRIVGMVHVSCIKEGIVRNAFDAVRVNQPVKVKVISIVNTKFRFSMKDVDQTTGEDLTLKKNIKTGLKSDRMDSEFLIEQKEDPTNLFKPIQGSNGELYGRFTGVRIDLDQMKEEEIRLQQGNPKKKQRLTSPERWELSRLQYQSSKMIGINAKDLDLDVPEDTMQDDVDQEVVVNDVEPSFLKGQTTKGGIVLSPIRVVRNPEGTLNRAALNAVQYAKDRKDVREQQNRALMDSMNKTEFSKNWDDPNADPGTRALVAQLKGYGLQQFEQPEYKKETLFKASKIVQRSLLSIKEQKESLPIYQYKSDLIKAIMDNRVLIVIGETGSGKTTQLTQYMLEAGYAKNGKKIGCTQPRRVAAMSVAKRVSEEMGVALGEEVGYSIRFEDCTSNSTVIKYMTDGMLLREALLDPEMQQYNVIMLDEAHERNLSTDVLFGLLKQVVQRRKDFQLIVTSATLDAEKFSSYFFDCKIFRIPGRTFPVEILYSTEPESDYLDAALIVVMQIHLHEPKGDILLFLTGQEEIDNACQTFHERMKKLGSDAPELIILPVYSALPSDQQNRIFLPTPEGSRKCIIATNIAEASLTIDGIYYVVDPGFAKIKVFNSKLGLDSLIIAPISQASARQRAGRAGRTGPGKCYRLYTEQAYKNEMLPTSVPEIQRTNLANTVLLLKAMGIHDLLNFDFMDQPPVQTMIAALELLYALGALDEDGMLTRLGIKMAEFPLEPPLSKMLLTSVDLGCSDEMCTVIAMLQVQNVFNRPKDKQALADQKRARFNQVEGDHLTLLTVYEAWKKNNFSNIWCYENYVEPRAMKRAQDVRKQLIDIMARYRFPVVSCGNDYAKLRKAISAGYFFHAAKKDRLEGYKTIIDHHTVFLHPSGSLFNQAPQWVVYHELVLTTKEYMRNVCCIEPKWLIDVAPNFFQFGLKDRLDGRKRKEKLEPLQSKYGDPNAWRLSRR